MMRILSRLLTLLIAAGIVTGCATEGEPQLGPSARGEDTSEEKFALLSLNTETRSGSTVEVNAQFVSYEGPDSDWALSVLDLWAPDSSSRAMLDACRLGAQPLYESETPEELPDYRVELLDAGRVQLSSPVSAELEPSYLPDLQLYLNGTLYSLEQTDLGYNPGSSYVIEAEGSNDVSPFSVAVTAPSPLILTAVDGARPDSSVEVLLPQDRDTNLEWTPGGGEMVYFDLYDDARAAAPVMSCVAADDGSFAIPAAAVQDLRSRFPDGALRLVARRATIHSFSLEGFEWARAVFSSSDTVFLR